MTAVACGPRLWRLRIVATLAQACLRLLRDCGSGSRWSATAASTARIHGCGFLLLRFCFSHSYERSFSSSSGDELHTFARLRLSVRRVNGIRIGTRVATAPVHPRILVPCAHRASAKLRTCRGNFVEAEYAKTDSASPTSPVHQKRGLDPKLCKHEYRTSDLSFILERIGTRVGSMQNVYWHR